MQYMLSEEFAGTLLISQVKNAVSDQKDGTEISLPM
jgi:hypothetical protein